MKKLLITFLSILMLGLFLSAQVNAKTAFIGVTGLKGGGVGALDAIECEDIRGDNSNRPIATGDVAVGLTSTKDIFFYRYNSTGADAEDAFGTNDPIVPDDRAQCSNQGQWELFDSINLARSSTPKSIYRDLEATDSDDNVYTIVNCTDTGSGTEDCDYEVIVQSSGVDQSAYQVDADGATSSVYGSSTTKPRTQLFDEIQIAVFDWAEDNVVVDGAAYFRVSHSIAGMDLCNVHAEVITAGTTGTETIEIYNVTQAVDMLTTGITIDTGETGSDEATTPPDIDENNDDVALNDIIRVDVDTIHSGTAAKGLLVTLGFCRP
jgi:hypothetical protein